MIMNNKLLDPTDASAVSGSDNSVQLHHSNFDTTDFSPAGSALCILEQIMTHNLK